MPKPIKPKVPEKADDKEQSEAFIRAAKEAETNDDREEFEKAFKTVSKHRIRRTSKSIDEEL